MKKVLFVIPSLGIGGAEKSLVELLNFLDYSKYHVDLLLLESHGLLFEQLNPNVNVLDADEQCRYLLKNASASIKYLLRRKMYVAAAKRLLLTCMNRLRTVFKLNMPHLQWRLLSSYISDFSQEYDTAVAYLQGVSEYYVVDKITAKQKILWMHTSFRHHSGNDSTECAYIDAFDKIVCVSSAAKDDFISLFPQKSDSTYVFYNLINKDAVRQAAEKEPEHILDTELINIVSVGRLHQAKGYDISIPAFAKLEKEFCRVRFFIVGDGPIRPDLEKLIQQYGLENKCILVGATTNPYSYMGRADVFLQSSRYEGYCIALAEAKALQCAIVTTDFYGAREQIINEENGLIVDCSENSIYEALKRTVSDAKLRTQFSETLREQESIRSENILDTILE